MNQIESNRIKSDDNDMDLIKTDKTITRLTFRPEK
jgi:hypothetical protein